MNNQEMTLNKQVNFPKILLVALVALTAAALHWFFFLSPNLELVREYRGQQEELMVQLDVLNRRVEQLPALRERLASLQAVEAELKEFIPSYPSLPQVLGLLDELIEELNLTREAVKVSGFVEEGEYILVNVQMTLAGRDNRLLDFLKEIEDYPHQLIIGRVAFTRDGNEPSLTLDIYVVMMPEETSTLEPDTDSLEES